MSVKASISSVIVDTHGREAERLSMIDERSSIDQRNSNQDSSSENENDSEKSLLRPFVDPNLLIRKQRPAEETWLKDFQSPSSAPQGAYSPIAQAVKSILPERTACRLGCRGNKCKYERSDYWRPEQMAIDGIFSTWITDSILACARPTMKHEKLKKLFHEAGIRAIFNLESPEEHVLCGHGNHESGFSYDPKEFMDVGIFIYNFAMEDYGTVKTESIVDIMKVMSFAMKQGKIAVHCHAGLGRTGFVICSYLVHEYRMTAHDSIHYVRGKRPGSVQMTKQIQSVVDYEKYLVPKRRIFTDCADVTESLPIDVHLANQRVFNHGRDEFIFKNIPKIIFVCAARLVALCSGYMMETVLLTINTRGRKKPIFIRNPNRILTNDEERTWLDFAPSFFYESEHQLHPDYVPCKEIMGCMIRSIDESFLTSEQESKVNEWKRKINRVNDGVEQLFEETDPCVISCLMWTWLRLLKFPIIRVRQYHLFTENEDIHSVDDTNSMLTLEQRGIIEVLAKMFAFLRHFADNHDGSLLIYCILYFLTQSSLPDTEELKKLTSDNKRIRYFLTGRQSNQEQSNVTTEKLPTEMLENFTIFFTELSSEFSRKRTA